MSDIVERLRANAEVHREVAYGCDMDPKRTANWDHAEDDIEAADEITRLRSLLKEAVEALLAISAHVFVDDELDRQMILDQCAVLSKIKGEA